MDKKIYLAAIAGIATLIVFGGCGQEAEDDTSLLFPTPTEITQEVGDDFDFEFDPSAELSVTPVADREQTTPTPKEEEIPDEEGNLPDEGELELMNTPIPEPTPTEVATPEPTPTKVPTEAPTSTPEPTAIPTPTKAVVPTPTQEATKPAEPTKEAEPTKVITAGATQLPELTTAPTKEAAKPTATPKPTKKAEPTKAASKEPTMEKDGYSFKDPTGLKAGATVGTLTNSNGNEVTIIHHEVGDLIEAWNDGLENDCTYLFHLEDDENYLSKGTWELICYGKYQPKDSDKNAYQYVDKQGNTQRYKNGKWKETPFSRLASSCDEPKERISTDGVENSGEHVGSWQ